MNKIWFLPSKNLIGLWENIEWEDILENKFYEQTNKQKKSAFGDFPNVVWNSELAKELRSTSSF